MRFFYPVLLTFSAAISWAAENTPLATPALGFAFDADARAIRPILGIPGAALLGNPIDTGSPLSAAAISPRHDFAIAAGADLPLRVLRFQDSGIVPYSLDNALASPDRIVFSPAGRSVLLYQKSGRLQTVTGLPDNPAVRDWNLPPAGGPAGAMTVSDDGMLILLVGDGGQDSDPVWLMQSDGGSSQLPLPGSIAAVSFRRNSHDLLAASTAGDLHLVRNPEGSAEFRVVPLSSGTSAPVAAVFSVDGTRAYAATADGTIYIADLATGTVAAGSCGCRPVAVEPLRSNRLFRVTAVSSSPLMLLDASGLAPRFWFVPPARASHDSEGGVQ
jgi:hypothetical protein